MDKEKEKRELFKKIQETDRRFERNKGRRMLYVIIFYAIINMVLFYVIAKGFDGLKDILACLVISVIVAWVEFWVNGTIFSQIIAMSRNENETLERMEERYKELEGEKEMTVEEFFKRGM